MSRPFDTLRAVIDGHGEVSYLSSAERLVYIHLAKHADGDGANAWPTLTTIAKQTGVTRRGVGTAVRVLQHVGLIEAKGSRSAGAGMFTVWQVNRPEAAGPKPDDLRELRDPGWRERAQRKAKAKAEQEAMRAVTGNTRGHRQYARSPAPMRAVTDTQTARSPAPMRAVTAHHLPGPTIGPTMTDPEPIDRGGDATRARGAAPAQVGMSQAEGVRMVDTAFGPRPAGAPPIEAPAVEPEEPAAPKPKTALERLVDYWRSGSNGFHHPDSDYDAIGDALAHLDNDEARVRAAIDEVRRHAGDKGRAIQVLTTARASVRASIQASKAQPKGSKWAYTAERNAQWANAPETGWPTGPMRKA